MGFSRLAERKMTLQLEHFKWHVKASLTPVFDNWLLVMSKYYFGLLLEHAQLIPQLLRYAAQCDKNDIVRWKAGFSIRVVHASFECGCIAVS